MKAVKGNKQYTIEENQKKAYVDAGFDIYEETGEQIAWGRGRTVPYDDRCVENEELKKEIEALKAENEGLKEAGMGQKAPDQKQGKKPAEKKESV